MTTLQVLLHVAAQRDYELHSPDFSTAFLQGSLHEEIWLCRPPGFTGSFLAGTQYSLRRPVYSLRQAPHEWHDTLRTTLAALGFTPSTADPSLFLHTDTSLPPFYVLVHVDNLVFATADTEALTLVKSDLQKRHICTDLGELHSYLGLLITRDRARRTITLTQLHMVHQVLQHFGFHFSSPQPTPLSTGHSLSTPPSDESVEPSGPYPELVGCLITSGMGLVLGGRGPVVLTGHADASWVDDSATQRSSQGYTFSLDSSSVSWRSTRSSSVLNSSSEAETYGGAMAARSYQRGQLRLANVATRANTADIFTKALPRGDHQRFTTVLGLARGGFLPAVRPEARGGFLPAVRPEARGGSMPAVRPEARGGLLPCRSPRRLLEASRRATGTLRGPAALPSRPRRPTIAAPPPYLSGPAALPSRPRRPTFAAPPPYPRGPAALLQRPRRPTSAAPPPYLRGLSPLSPFLPSPPISRRPSRLLRGPRASCGVAGMEVAGVLSSLCSSSSFVSHCYSCR
ncbi:unnamed protein product [Closterium sp. NIES-53]